MALGIIGLAALFFVTALLYASVGFGGGSTYIALLALAEIDYRALPIIALLCNVIVVTGGSIRFHLRRLIDWRRVWPIFAMSVPAAWAGGMVPIDRENFLILLGISLFLAALLLLLEPWFRQQPGRTAGEQSNSVALSSGLGAGIGFLSGMVGIGGGIFLAPILLLINWADSRRIAAAASVFILVNSLAGLGGQLMKSGWDHSAMAITAYLPLFIAVLIGGQLGSHLATKTLSEIWIRRLTALLILYVAIRILWQQLI